MNLCAGNIAKLNNFSVFQSDARVRCMFEVSEGVYKIYLIARTADSNRKQFQVHAGR